MLASILFFFLSLPLIGYLRWCGIFQPITGPLLLSGQQHIKKVTIWGAQVSNLLLHLICFSDLALTTSFADYLAWIPI